MEKNILASELPLTKQGTLYHLQIMPEELYDNVILVGDPARVEMIAKRFDTIDFRGYNREIHFCSGRIKGVGITAISTGMGVDNLDIVVTELDVCANFDLKTSRENPTKRRLNLLRLGTCGALHRDLACGSRVVSKYVVGIDGIMYYYKNAEGVIDLSLTERFISFMGWDNSLPKPYGVECSDLLLRRLGMDMSQGITITAPGFYGPQGRSVRLPLAFKDINRRLVDFSFKGLRAANYEMETSSLYALAKNLGHNALTICLVVANREAGEFLEDYHKEMGDLIDTLLERLVC